MNREETKAPGKRSRSNLRVFLASLCLCGFPACGGRAGGDLDGGLEFLGKRELDKAAEVFRAMGDDRLALRFLGRLHLLRNQAADAEKLFARAVALYRKDEPMDFFLVQDMTWARLRLDDYMGAASAYELLGKLPLAARAKEMGRKVAYVPEWRGESTSVRLAFSQPLAAVSAIVNGRFEGTFVIDTSVGDLVLDRKFAGRAGVQVHRGTDEIGWVDEIEIGRLRMRTVPVEVRPLPDLGTHRIDGLIGTQFLSHFRVRLDVKRGRLELAPPGDVESEGVPMLFGADRYVLLQGRLAGKDAWFHLNTGLAACELGPSPVLTKVENLELGPLGRTKPTTKAEGYQAGVDAIFGFPVDGTVGYPLLRDRALTLDFRSMRATIE